MTPDEIEKTPEFTEAWSKHVNDSCYDKVDLPQLRYAFLHGYMEAEREMAELRVILQSGEQPLRVTALRQIENLNDRLKMVSEWKTIAGNVQRTNVEYSHEVAALKTERDELRSEIAALRKGIATSISTLEMTACAVR